MIPLIQPVLYTDPQTEEPGCYCRICGRECDGEKDLCPDCEEES